MLRIQIRVNGKEMKENIRKGNGNKVCVSPTLTNNIFYKKNPKILLFYFHKKIKKILY